MADDATGYDDSGADDSGGYADDSGASYGTSAYAGDASPDAGYATDDTSGDTGGDGGWGGVDPSSYTDSLTGGLGDAASSAWHAAGHVAHGVYDVGAAGVHSVEAGADAWMDDRAGANHQMDEGEAAAADAHHQFHEAGQDLWGN